MNNDQTRNTGKILITGITGFIGSHLAPYLIQQGYKVSGTTRNQNKHVIDDANVEYITIPSIHEVTDWTPYLKNVSAVIHLAATSDFDKNSNKKDYDLLEATNIQATINLAHSVAQKGNCRFIFLSSIKVNGETTDNRSPFKYTDEPKPTTPYAISKFKAEQALQTIAKSTGMDLVIIRPSLVYGLNPRGSIKKLIKMIQKGIPLPLGLVHNERSLLNIENLCPIINKCITSPSAVNQIFLIADDDKMSSKILCRTIAKHLEKGIIFLPIPPLILRALGNILGKTLIIQSLISSLEVDINHTKELLKISDQIPLAKGIENMITNTNKPRNKPRNKQ